MTCADNTRASIDSELAALSPAEREAYLKEYNDEDDYEPKKGGLIDKLIAKGNKRTEDQLAKEHQEREALKAGKSTGTGTGVGGDGVIR